jgi:hypothetical protein
MEYLVVGRESQPMAQKEGRLESSPSSLLVAFFGLPGEFV